MYSCYITGVVTCHYMSFYLTCTVPVLPEAKLQGRGESAGDTHTHFTYLHRVTRHQLHPLVHAVRSFAVSTY